MRLCTHPLSLSALARLLDPSATALSNGSSTAPAAAGDVGLVTIGEEIGVSMYSFPDIAARLVGCVQKLSDAVQAKVSMSQNCCRLLLQGGAVVQVQADLHNARLCAELLPAAGQLLCSLKAL